MRRKSKEKSSKIVSKRSAAIGLIANLFLPGLGTIITGKYDIATVQIILSITGLFFLITTAGVIIGVMLFLAAWIWALITGIKTLKKAKHRPLKIF